MITFPSDVEVVTASTSAAGGFVHSPYPAYRTEDTILDLEEHYAPSPTSPVFSRLPHFWTLYTFRSSFPIASRDGFRSRISSSRFVNALYSSADSSEVSEWADMY
ncbi:uncharacterized protein ARMOST_08729 [Armillaria ostoyae]|uniref:Uncharacterized protein n=1 Tax=Armillaria ostoyae TaxID=47428 RepID=A0A284R9J1_ARMOS|nr:uncharacterized protein ARMOST_08729 [Armillaria ostoyae]